MCRVKGKGFKVKGGDLGRCWERIVNSEGGEVLEQAAQGSWEPQTWRCARVEGVMPMAGVGTSWAPRSLLTQTPL